MKLSVTVDGKKLFLNEFMMNLTGNLIEAIARSLKAPSGRQLELTCNPESLKIVVDHDELPLSKGSASRIIGGLIRGLTSSFHGAENGKEFIFILEREEADSRTGG